jgi:hypothetical protein
MLRPQWTRGQLALVCQARRPRMATHKLILRRTDQRVLRVDNDVREYLRRAERDVWRAHQGHPRSCVRVHHRLRYTYRGLRPEASTSQVSASQRGFNGLKKFDADCFGMSSVFTDMYPTNSRNVNPCRLLYVKNVNQCLHLPLTLWLLTITDLMMMMMFIYLIIQRRR